MHRLSSLFVALPLLVLGAIAGCATPTDSDSESEAENVASVSQSYEVGPETVIYHVTWYADDADVPNSYEDPLVWTRDFVTAGAGLTSEDWQIEYTWGYGKQMIALDDFQNAVTVSTYLSTVPVPPIGSRIEVTIGDPGRRW